MEIAAHQDPFGAGAAPVVRRRIRQAPRPARVVDAGAGEEDGWVDVPTAAGLLGVPDRRVREMARSEIIEARKNEAGAWRIRVNG